MDFNQSSTPDQLTCTVGQDVLAFVRRVIDHSRLGNFDTVGFGKDSAYRIRVFQLDEEGRPIDGAFVKGFLVLEIEISHPLSVSISLFYKNGQKDNTFDHKGDVVYAIETAVLTGLYRFSF